MKKDSIQRRPPPKTSKTGLSEVKKTANRIQTLDDVWSKLDQRQFFFSEMENDPLPNVKVLIIDMVSH